MKKLANVLAIACCITALLSSCSNVSESKTAQLVGAVAGYDQYINLPGSIALMSEGYYFRNEEFLFYLDSSLQYPAEIVCSKAICNHTDGDQCSALIPTGTMFAWNDRLYYIQHPDRNSSFVLFEMDSDGTNRRRVAELNIDFGSGGTWYTRSACGYIAFCYTYSSAGRSTDITTLYLISMEDPGADPIVLYSNEEVDSPAGAQWNEVPRPFPMYITEGNVFYLVEQHTQAGFSTKLYCYQTSTGETNLLLENKVTGADDLALVGDVLYWFDADGALYGIDLASGNIEQKSVIPLKEEQYGACDDSWLYIFDGIVDALEAAEVVIYDYQGLEIQRLSCKELGTTLSFAFSTPEKVFFRVSGLIRDASILPICYLEKDAIEQGTAEFILID